MGYYMRYAAADTREITPCLLETVLRALDPWYRLEAESRTSKLMYGDGTYGRMSLLRAGEEEFQAEMADLRAAMADISLSQRKTVHNVLRQAETLVVLKVVWEARDTESTMERIHPLWRWLLENRTGLLQVDDEGYYGPNGLLLKVR